MEKNKREQIRIEATEYKGQDLVDIRVYYQDQTSGEWKPSKKGIAFKVELLPEVIKALQALETTQ
ncbi:MAG: transcriptional coactivator p15/PC4 family protein [Moorella humiferrea]|nr:transcriptional coactivator p15/PC4 family protein [Moorella humiferrea]